MATESLNTTSTYLVNPSAWPMLNAAAANPLGTIVIPPGQSFSWNTPPGGCAPTFTGWWTTINVGGPSAPDGDDGTAGVREPVRR